MNAKSQSQNKWCKYCNRYQKNSYYDAHSETEKHKNNVIRNQTFNEPIVQQIIEKEFIIDPSILELNNIYEDGNLKNATAIKYTKTYEQENKELNNEGFQKIITTYYNHFKK